jgi:hypothetical protein
MKIFKNKQSLPSAKKLDFIIAGTQKSGTSALYYYLKQHPEIALGKRKELHFFDNEEFFKRRKPNYNILHDQINYLPGSKITGDCTPIYMYWTPAMRRIWDYNPEMKIIVILRNPVKRAYSQWNMLKTNGEMALDFGDYILREGELARKDLPNQSKTCSCIDRGFYSGQLRRIFAFFRKEQVLILKYEYFKENQLEVINKILGFLEIDANLLNFREEQVNTTNYYSEMPLKEEEYLLGIYENEIKEVELMLGWNCADWKKTHGK